MSVSFDDGAIHARGESKVIGIHDQTTHRVSLAGRKRERGHQEFCTQRIYGSWFNFTSDSDCEGCAFDGFFSRRIYSQ